MAPDRKEKKRQLTEAEKRRLARYEEQSADYIARGYRRTELTVGIVKANIFSILYGIPLCVVGIVVFFLANPGTELFRLRSPYLPVLYLALLFALVVVHELVHGITWSLFAENRWKDIEFGFMKEYLTPYCTCGCPLSRGRYILGALMPLILLGILPMAAGIAAGSFYLLLVGIVMTIAAGGDILIVIQILRHRGGGGDVFYMDHPTQAGGVIFEK